MESKKEPGADLSGKSGLFLGVGATVALSLVISAFEWKSYNDPLIDLRPRLSDVFEQTVDIPRTEILPPAPKPRPVEIVEVPNETPVDLIPIIDIEWRDSVEVFAPPVVVPEEPTDEPFLHPEQSAEPKGGFAAFYKYVGDNFKYPPQARRIGIEGRVFVEFVINKDGMLTEVKAVKGIGAGCDEEAVRVIQSAPPWNPGKQRGKPVRQRYTLPIIFKLG